MKNKIILSLGVISLLSVKLLAVDGWHGALVTGNGDNNEVCVYCHTPHGAASGELAPIPLWNKPLSKGVADPSTAFNDAPATYPMYGETIAGTSTAAIPQNQSLACLACHDGVSAMNSVINAPGAGYGQADGLIGYDNEKVMPNSIFTVGFVGTAFNPSTGTLTYNNGLANDHPVSIPYIAGKGSLKPIDTPLVNWVGAKKIADLLRGPNKDQVECASCHDPHTMQNDMYRRTSNNNSQLCFGCHDK